MMGSYSREINVQNVLEHYKDGFYYLQNESVYMKVFLLNMHEATGFIRSGKAYTSFNLFRMVIFLYKNYWPHLT